MNRTVPFRTRSAQAISYGNSTQGLWHHIKHWSRQRPYWGAFCVLVASVLILWAPVCLLQNDIVPPGSLWAGLLVGGLLFVMGLIELLAPAHALVAGAIGVVLALVSLVTVLGGFGIGMLLAVIGSSYAVAWKPESKTANRLVFWSVFGCAIGIAFGMTMLITNGMLAIAAPVVGPITSTTGRSECHHIRTIPAISQVDHRTPVLLSYASYCTTSNIVITQRVLGGMATVRVTQAHATSSGVTAETVASQTGTEQNTDATVSAANGIEADNARAIDTDVTAETLYSHADTLTLSGVTVSIILNR